MTLKEQKYEFVVSWVMYRKSTGRDEAKDIISEAISQYNNIEAKTANEHYECVKEIMHEYLDLPAAFLTWII